MTSVGNSFPPELIDIIIGYVKIEENAIDPEDGKRKHNCQYRNCRNTNFVHDQSLLSFSQVCVSFRKRSIHHLWSNVIISFHPDKGIHLPLGKMNENSFYLRHIKNVCILAANLDVFNWTPWWLWKHEKMPFGVFVYEPIQKSERATAFIIRKCIQSVLEGKLRHIEIIQDDNLREGIDFLEYSSGEPLHEIYQIPELLPFWLCVSDPNSQSQIGIVFTKLKKMLNPTDTRLEGDWLHSLVKSILKLRMFEFNRRHEDDLYGTQVLDDDHFRYLRQSIDNLQDLDLCRQVQKLFEYEWESPKLSGKEIQSIHRHSIPFWLREDVPYLATSGLPTTFEYLKRIITACEKPEGEDWVLKATLDYHDLHNRRFRNRYNQLRELDLPRLPGEGTSRHYLDQAFLALKEDERLRKQVKTFYENGWRSPREGNFDNGGLSKNDDLMFNGDCVTS